MLNPREQKLLDRLLKKAKENPAFKMNKATIAKVDAHLAEHGVTVMVLNRASKAVRLFTKDGYLQTVTNGAVAGAKHKAKMAAKVEGGAA